MRSRDDHQRRLTADDTLSGPNRKNLMSTTANQPNLDEVARYRQGVRVFQAHAAVAAGSIALMLAVNLLTNLSAGIAGEITAWWSLWAVVGWSAGLGVHGFVVWLARPVSDSDDGLEAR
jgi:hypothetical protein